MQLDPRESCKCVDEDIVDDLYTCEPPAVIEDEFDCDRFGNKICPKHPRRCPRGQRYDHDACTCVAEYQCEKLCRRGQTLDPREVCSCVDKSVVKDLYTCEPKPVMPHYPDYNSYGPYRPGRPSRPAPQYRPHRPGYGGYGPHAPHYGGHRPHRPSYSGYGVSHSSYSPHGGRPYVPHRPPRSREPYSQSWSPRSSYGPYQSGPYGYDMPSFRHGHSPYRGGFGPYHGGPQRYGGHRRPYGGRGYGW